MSALTVTTLSPAAAGPSPSAQADEKANASLGVVHGVAVQRFNPEEWNEVSLQLPSYQPNDAFIRVSHDCPLVATAFKELAEPYLTAQPPRRYFVILMETKRSHSAAICDAEGAHEFILASGYKNPYNIVQNVVKIHYFVTTGSPVFQHVLTPEKLGISSFMLDQILANSIKKSGVIQAKRVQLLSLYLNSFNKLMDESERKRFDQDFVQFVLPGFQEGEDKVNGAVLQQKLDDEFLHTLKLIAGDEPSDVAVGTPSRALLRQFLTGSKELQPRRGKIVKETLGHIAVVQEALGYIYFSKDWVKAEEHFREAVKLDDSLIFSHAAIGTCLCMRGFRPQAIEYLTNILNKYKDHKDLSPVYAELATALVKINRPKEALPHAERSYYLCKRNKWVPLTISSVIHFKLNNFVGAKLCAKESLKEEPKGIDALITLANVARKEGDSKTEADMFVKILGSVRANDDLEQIFGEPYLAESYGEYYRIRTCFDLAKKNLQSALEKYGEYPSSEVYLYLGKLALDEGDIKKAHEYLGKSVQLYSENWESLTLLGRVEGQLGNFAQGKEHLKRVIGISQAHFFLGEILKKEGNLRAAREAFVEAIKLELKVEYLNSLGEVHELLEEFDQARAAFESSVKLGKKPDEQDSNDFAHAHLGKIYKLAGDFKNAEEHLELALTINKSNVFAVACLEELYVAKAQALSTRRLALRQGKGDSQPVAAASSKEKAAEKPKDLSVVAADVKEKAALIPSSAEEYPGTRSKFKAHALGERMIFECDNEEALIQKITIDKHNDEMRIFLVFRNTNLVHIRKVARYFDIKISYGETTGAAVEPSRNKVVLTMLLVHNDFEPHDRKALVQAASDGNWPDAW